MKPSPASLKSHIKSLKKSKGAISSQFKNAKNNPELLANLKAQMQAISQEIADAEAQYKAAVAKLNIATQSPAQAENNDTALPEQFSELSSEFSEEFSIVELPKNEWHLWQAFCNTAKHTSLCHQPAIFESIEAAFKHKTRILVAKSGGTIIGGLPLTKLSSKLFGTFLVSTPYFNYGGPLTDYRNVFEALMLASKPLLHETQASHAEIRTTVANANLPFADKKASMILALPSSTEQLDKQVGSKVRAQFNKANENNPTVSFGHLNLLDDFYRVFARNMRDLGTPVYSKHWFETLLKQLGKQATLVVVYVNKLPVGSAFLTAHRTMLEIPWASTIKPANSMNINMWMYRQILGHAISQNYQYFDFGRSTINAGTYKFKKQWGAKPVAHYWYYTSDEGGYVAQTNPDNPKFKLLIAVWKRLPVWVANLIGPLVIGNLP